MIYEVGGIKRPFCNQCGKPLAKVYFPVPGQEARPALGQSITLERAAGVVKGYKSAKPIEHHEGINPAYRVYWHVWLGHSGLWAMDRFCSQKCATWWALRRAPIKTEKEE